MLAICLDGESSRLANRLIGESTLVKTQVPVSQAHNIGYIPQYTVYNLRKTLIFRDTTCIVLKFVLLHFIYNLYKLVINTKLFLNIYKLKNILYKIIFFFIPYKLVIRKP